VTETRLYLAVGCGAALGALLRAFTGAATVGVGLPAFAATGFVNLAGSFVIGFVATISGPDGRVLIRPVRRQFVMSGLCGGFTTFSAMSLDALLMLLDGRAGAAGAYLGGVVVLSLAAVWAGHALAARLNR
jgi:fluoride exporter